MELSKANDRRKFIKRKNYFSKTNLRVEKSTVFDDEFEYLFAAMKGRTNYKNKQGERKREKKAKKRRENQISREINKLICIFAFTLAVCPLNKRLPNLSPCVQFAVPLDG